MYHMLLIVPNQEEARFFERMREALTTGHPNLQLTYLTSVQELTRILTTTQFSSVVISASYSPRQLLERLTVLAKHIGRKQKLIPLVYYIHWPTPLPCLLGTSWAGKVGVMHSMSSVEEIKAMFARLDGPAEALAR
jgi:hypothetical protein